MAEEGVVVADEQDEAKGKAASEATIYQTIHSAIAEHRLPAGTRLVEDQLARTFGVSRARIRSVLQSLARDRMVTLHRNRGAFVTYPSVAEAREVFQARRLIESALIREAAKSVSPRGLARLAQHVEHERQANMAGDRRAEIKLSGDFHLLVAEIVGNATLTGYLAELIARSSLVVAVYERPGSGHCSIAEHSNIIAALAEGDPGAAAAIMDTHLADVEARLSLLGDEARGEVNLSTLFGL